MNIRPLTKEHRQFAEENHDLIYTFLKKRKLSKTVFYDVVVFGYLRAVQEYCDNPNLHIYKFSTLAWKRMSTHYQTSIKYLSRSKRSISTVSLDDRSERKWECYWRI